MCHGIIERKKKKKKNSQFLSVQTIQNNPKVKGEGAQPWSAHKDIKRLAIFEGLGLTASQASVCGCKGLFQFCFFHE